MEDAVRAAKHLMVLNNESDDSHDRGIRARANTETPEPPDTRKPAYIIAEGMAAFSSSDT